MGLDVVGQLESPCAPLLFILLYTIKKEFRHHKNVSLFHVITF